MFAVEVRGDRAVVLTIEDHDGVEYMVSNDEIPAECVQEVAKRLGCKVRYLPACSIGGPVYYWHNGESLQWAQGGRDG